MKSAAQMLVLRSLGAFALGTMFLVLGAFMAPGVITNLPRLVSIATFYGGAYLLVRLFTTAAQ